MIHVTPASSATQNVLNTLAPVDRGKAKHANAQTSGTSTTVSNSSTASGAGSLGTTFLSLLAQELQNQDPTAPVDPTAMVGQMISLNQLEQLISINQTLTPTTATSAAGEVQQTGMGLASGSLLASTTNGIAGALSPSAAAAATTQLPFDPTTMMPLGFGNPGAMAASINTSINAANMNYSGNTNNATGGK